MKLFDVYPLFNLNIVKGKGAYVWDDQGTKYLDFYGGHAVISIGHNHPDFVSRLSEQLNELLFYSNSVLNTLQEDLAKKLGAISGYPDFSLFLCNSGAEANENALKLASFYNERKKIIAFKKGFHGRTSLAVSVTDNPNIVAPVNKNHDVVFLDLNDHDALKRELEQGDVCAVIIEGIQGIGGIHIPDPSFLQTARRLCDKYNTILILDEIQSGYGRSGKFFAHQYAAVTPDLITLAKGMGNGFPVGGVLIHPRFAAKHGMLGTTFGGNHLACAAAIAVLETIKLERLVENAAAMGQRLKEALAGIPEIKEVRGQGLMIALEFDAPVAEIRKKLLFDCHIFTGVSGKNIIRLLPPLTIGEKEIQLFIDKLKLTLNKSDIHEKVL